MRALRAATGWKYLVKLTVGNHTRYLRRSHPQERRPNPIVWETDRALAIQFDTPEDAQTFMSKYLSGDQKTRAKVIRYSGPHKDFVPPPPPPPKDMDLPLEDFLKKYQHHEMYSDFIVKRYGQEIFEQLKKEGRIIAGGGWSEESNSLGDTWIVQ